MAERAGRRRVLELADPRAAEVLLVAELSRIGRSLSGLANVVERLSARGVGIVSLRESFDRTSPMGRMIVGILAVLAQFEADVLTERTIAGLVAWRCCGMRGHSRGPRSTTSDPGDIRASLDGHPRRAA
ncbi:MAG: recombinase family protein [Planctomycetes bacterium]|nr:recombinase family protein [Planctomycetota bacterium]